MESISKDTWSVWDFPILSSHPYFDFHNLLFQISFPAFNLYLPPHLPVPFCWGKGQVRACAGENAAAVHAGREAWHHYIPQTLPTLLAQQNYRTKHNPPNPTSLWHSAVI